MSNPAVHNVTAAVSQRMRASRDAADRDPCRCRSDPESESENHMGERRKSFRIGIDRAPRPAPPAQAENTADSRRPRRSKKTNDARSDEGPGEDPGQQARRDMTRLRSSIPAVDVRSPRPG